MKAGQSMHRPRPTGALAHVSTLLAARLSEIQEALRTLAIDTERLGKANLDFWDAGSLGTKLCACVVAQVLPIPDDISEQPHHQLLGGPRLVE
eukprot:9493020-Alexandrium_andersonii.AAC.1